MSKLINKTRPENFVKMHRDLLRDRRLKATPKLIYSLLRSLAQSCEEVFPSFLWIAEEIGYDITELEEAKEKNNKELIDKVHHRINEFMKYNIKPLLDIGLIKAVHTQGAGYNYEIYDFDPPENSVPPLQKILQGDPPENSVPIYKKNIEEEREEKTPLVETEEKEVERAPIVLVKIQPPDFSELIHTTLNFNEGQKCLPDRRKLVELITERLETENAIRAYLAFVLAKKTNQKDYTEAKTSPYKHEYWIQDYSRFKAASTSETTSKHELDVWQRPNETLEDFEARCESREALGDVRIREHYLETPNSSNLKARFEVAKKAMLETKFATYA